MSRRSNFKPGGGNVFQRIKAVRAKAESQGIKVINLAVGEPAGPALRVIRDGIKFHLDSDEQAMYQYQDNTCHPAPDFAQRFVQCHVQTDLSKLPKGMFDTVPTVGSKSMLQIIIEAMNSWEKDQPEVHVCTMTNPGYGSPVVQAKMVRGVVHHHLPLRPENGFLFTIEDLEKMDLPEGRTLIMLNLPHNPTGAIATREFLQALCAYCTKKKYWLSNDAAYAIITYGAEATSLTDVAVNYMDLNWCEEFSASKAGNNTGLRVGAIIGSPEFVADIKQVKGDIDSGFVAPVALGILEAFERNMGEIVNVRKTYQERMNRLIDVLEGAGMRLAVQPEGGFFILFDAPKQAFGQPVENAEAFNNAMLLNTGVLGVPFGDKLQWIRYAVCATDVLAEIDAIRDGFAKADVKY